MAKRIAHKFGVKHVNRLPAAISEDHFIQNCDVLAYYRNGSSNGKWAMRPLFQYNPNENLIFGGLAGEIFRGMWYPRAENIHLANEELAPIIFKKYLRLETLPWYDKNYVDRFKIRVEKIINYFSTFATNSYDILDLVHLLERWPHWAEGVWEPHYERVKSPFYRVNLVLAAFKLPPPIGWKSPIHRQIIKQNLGPVFWWPINNKRILPFDYIKSLKGVWRIEKLLCRLSGASVPYRQGIDKKLANDGLDVISQWTGPFRNLIREYLFGKDSLAVNVLEYNKLLKMFEKYCKREMNLTEIIGSLITIERWRSMVLRAKMASQRE
jgi:hypothetical protein